MERKWSGLMTAVTAAVVFLHAAAPEVIFAPLRGGFNCNTLAALVLSMELGGAAVWATPTRSELGEEPDGTSRSEPGRSATPDAPEPEETPGPTAGITPEVTTEPTPGPTETPTPEPSATPTEDEPTASPEPTAEVRDFTDTPGVAVKNNTSRTPDIAGLLAAGPSQQLSGAGPQILIIHTHSTEAYRQSPGEEYESADPYRTTDPEHSVIRVGDVLQRALEAQGLQVIHDRGLYDYPSYTGSYTRSGEAVEAWLGSYPTIGVVIDLHRDAVGTNEVVYRTVARLAAESAAQVMLVVGTGENGLEHPHWEENLKLALALQSAMDAQSPTLTRPIHLAQERYNQHLTTGSLILEVGTNGNTLTEAIRAVELFAQAAGPVFLSLLD